MKFSIIIPTFNRPDEVTELLESLQHQNFRDFEVIIADGSPATAVKEAIEPFLEQLNLIYLYEKGLGISESRNWGVQRASGDYVIFMDSDCIAPPSYLNNIDSFLKKNTAEVFGGPDATHKSFTTIQKAISYAMTSPFTTGGIRGRKKHLGKYQPRSFNMGVLREAFNRVGGFSGLKVSEDIDLSIRLDQAGYRTVFIPEAYVYHKRRSTFYKFYKQTNSFGRGRVDLYMRHGNAIKLVHLLPSLFVLYNIAGILSLLVSMPVFYTYVITILAFSLILFIHSSIKNQSIPVGLMSIAASFVMLAGYGTGMICNFISRVVLKSSRESEKPEITKE
ncbi:MAG: glycosyltransferase [Bacteroidales bacterium]|nr:glycosyltransferase [Bacteroidales bacterium]